MAEAVELRTFLDKISSSKEVGFLKLDFHFRMFRIFQAYPFSHHPGFLKFNLISFFVEVWSLKVVMCCVQ